MVSSTSTTYRHRPQTRRSASEQRAGPSQHRQLPSGDTPTLGLTRGPDGNVWFVEPAHVAKITPLGSISEYSYPSGEVRNVNSGAAVGADKNVWFTVTSHVLGKPNLTANINPSTSKITEHVLLSKCTTPAGLASNVDGFLYVGCASSQGSIVQVATSGAQTSLSLGGRALSPGLGVVTSSGRGQILVAAGGRLAKLDAPTGEVIVFAPPFNASFSGVLFGPDQNLYALTSGGLVIHIVDRLVVSPTSIEFPVVGQKATITAQYVGSGKLTAGSSNLKVASVAPGVPGSFTVNSTGNGTADITVQDGRGNYATVVVTSP